MSVKRGGAMNLPTLPFAANNKVKKSVINWAGLNKQIVINDNQFSDMENLSSENFSIISPRPSREAAYTLTTGKALFAAPALCWVDGTSFKYDNTAEGTVSASGKIMADFNNTVYILPDKKYYNYSTDTFGTWGSGTYPEAGSVPAMDYMAVMDNRLFGCKGDDIYGCALGDATDWTTFDGVSTDAYAADTGTNGDFTGMINYKGTILLFKADRVFKLFGDIPSNFQWVEISRLGCVDDKSICEVNGILFWLNAQGICAYTGGVPEIISDDLNETYTSGVAGGDGRRYYISLYNGTDYNLYVYDTQDKIRFWLREDDLQVTDFALLSGYLYALASDNIIYKFNSGSDTVSWYATTKEFTENVANKKGHGDLYFRVDLESSSSLKIYVRINNGSFTLVKSYSSSDLSSFKVMLPIKRADHFQVKFMGTGEGKIYEMHRKFYVGSEY
jgi:hypothetical protein